MQRLRVRQAQAADAPILCAAERETALVPGRLISLPHELRESAFTQKIEELAQNGRYLVAERDGRIVGHALLEPLAPLRALGHVRSLTIVVHPGNQRRGIGAMLMVALLDWARASGNVSKIELRVREGNEAAMKLYKKFGFVEEGRFRKRIRLVDGSELDDVCMALFFPYASSRS